MNIDSFSLDFFSLKGKTAIVTGGNCGLGLAFSTALAKAGADLFIPSIVTDDGEACRLVEKQGCAVETMEVDITAPGVPRQIIETCKEKFGKLDILVNNAGICKSNSVLEFDRRDWDPMIAINLTAAFEMSHEAAKLMIPQKSGKIINICSLYSFLGGAALPSLRGHQTRHRWFDQNVLRGIGPVQYPGKWDCTGVFCHRTHPKDL